MILKIFYILTCYLPRRIPADETEYTHFKDVLVDYYGVANEPKSWSTVAGCLAGVPGTRLRVPWGKIANCAKRLEINALAQRHRMEAVGQLQERLKHLLKAEAERVQKEQPNGPDQGNETLEPSEDAEPHPSPEQGNP